MTPDDARRAAKEAARPAAYGSAWPAAYGSARPAATAPARPAATTSYDTPTIALHWATALLVAVLWAIGETIDFAPKGPLRVDYTSLHIVLGALLGLVLLARLAWRHTRGARLAVEGHRLLALAAQAVHWLLYLLVGGTVALGLATAWAQGRSLFGLFNLPSFAPGDRALAEQIFSLHSLGATAVLILAGLHAAAALGHHYVMRDGTLRRMLPGRSGIE